MSAGATLRLIGVFLIYFFMATMEVFSRVINNIWIMLDKPGETHCWLLGFFFFNK